MGTVHLLLTTARWELRFAFFIGSWPALPRRRLWERAQPGVSSSNGIRAAGTSR